MIPPLKTSPKTKELLIAGIQLAYKVVKEVSDMAGHKLRNLVSILMESPLYLTLPVEERLSLITRLTGSYPFLFEDRDDEMEIGYESSWAGINHIH